MNKLAELRQQLWEEQKKVTKAEKKIANIRNEIIQESTGIMGDVDQGTDEIVTRPLTSRKPKENA